LDRDFLLAPPNRNCSLYRCSCTVLRVVGLHSLSVCQSCRQIAPPNKSFARLASQHRELPTPRTKETETSRSSRLGLSEEHFARTTFELSEEDFARDNTRINHPELCGVCERGWNERIGKHSLASSICTLQSLHQCVCLRAACSIGLTQPRLATRWWWWCTPAHADRRRLLGRLTADEQHQHLQSALLSSAAAKQIGIFHLLRPGHHRHRVRVHFLNRWAGDR
jgi:hypothetical protein